VAGRAHRRGIRGQLRSTAEAAGVRRRFAPHQLRHAHAVEMSREGIPLLVIQRQLGHADLGITSAYLRGIDNTETIHAVLPHSLERLHDRAVCRGAARALAAASVAANNETFAERDPRYVVDGAPVAEMPEFGEEQGDAAIADETCFELAPALRLPCGPGLRTDGPGVRGHRSSTGAGGQLVWGVTGEGTDVLMRARGDAMAPGARRDR
jgi:hypothetical protein